SSVHYTATTIENIFQLTEPGEQFFNLGLFAEYSHSAFNNEANSFTVGPIVQKELFDVLGVDSLHTLNVFVGHDVGHNASHATSLDVAWQSRLLLPRLPGWRPRCVSVWRHGSDRCARHRGDHHARHVATMDITRRCAARFPA